LQIASRSSCAAVRPFSLRRAILLLFVFTMLAFLLACGTGSDSAVFSYGSVALGTHVSRIAITVSNSSKAAMSLSPQLSGGADFSIVSAVSCGASLPAGGVCSVIVDFNPKSAGPQTTTLDMGMASGNQRRQLRASGVQLEAGQSIVSTTDNPLVARYTYAPPVAGDVSIQFGLDTAYGQQTSTQTVAAATPAMFLVAGMQANSTYHMQAVVATSGGSTTTDSDQMFTTSNFPADRLPSLTVTTNGTPQPGIEFMNPALAQSSTYLQAYAVDLEGNVIWGYDYPDRRGNNTIQSFKLLPNGDMLVLICTGSQGVTGPPAAGDLVAIREIDLSGVPVREVTLDQINTGLANLNSGIALDDLHHDVTPLPNGHWLVLGNYIKSLNGLPGKTGATDVLGDVVVDLDTSGNAVWYWDQFAHLDVNRAPAGYPDWTHSNAILYSAADGNFLVSSRHQSWVMKVDYNNGAGSGAVLWRLGYQGDFTLINGASPQDWFWGQHQPAFFSANSTGVFQLTLMDNGFLRQLTPGAPCTGTACYSTAPILQVDETAKTATIVFRDTPGAFAIWGGGTTTLANGNLEFDLCGEPNFVSEVEEVTLGTTPQTVWSLSTNGQNLYRANRMPSMYPGVQW
jgi:arylsulfate sulfotransferase